MKKLFLLLIISVALFLNGFSQNIFDEQTENFQPNMEHEDIWKSSVTNSEFNSKSLITILSDSSIRWEWDTLTTTWQFSSKTKDYVYNSNNKLTSFVTQEWNGGMWVNDRRTTNTYNPNNNRTNNLIEVWNGSTWVNDLQQSYAYNANNNRTLYIKQQWNGSTWDNVTRNTTTYNANQTIHEYQVGNVSAWVNDYRATYTYDANHNQIGYLKEDGNGSNWVNELQNSYTYDVNNNLTSFTKQNWNGSAWVDISKLTHTYDANYNRTISLYQNKILNAWLNDMLYTYTYDVNNNKTSYLSQNWNGTWVNDKLYTYTYDTNNNKITDKYQTWNGSAWANDNLYTFAYDANNNQINKIHQIWNGNSWENVGKYSYTYNSNNSQIMYLFYYWVDNAWEINQQEINTYDADNFLEVHTYKFLHNQGTFVSTADSTHYYYHSVIPTCYAGFVLYPDTIEHNWLVSATANGIEPFSYLWEWGDGTTSTEASPTHTYDIPGYYPICMTITDSSGCTDTYCDSSTYVFKTGAEMITVNVINHVNVGIEEETVINSLLVYPNPASNSLTIETATTQGIYQLQDLTGKQLLSGTITATKFSLDVSTLSKGIYLLSLFDGEQMVHRKIVKE